MQDATLEVESNIMATEKLKGQADRRRHRGQASTSSTLSSEPKSDKMTKMIESLATEISKLKVEQNSGKTRQQSTFSPRNPNPFRRENEQLQIMRRGEESKEDQKVKAPSKMFSWRKNNLKKMRMKFTTWKIKAALHF